MKFDDNSVFGISEDVFLSTGLEIGSIVDDDLFRELEEKETFQQAWHSALLLLNYRLRSCAEIQQRLRDKSYDQSTIDAVLEKLTKKNILDDEIFAQAFIKDKIQFRYLGPVALRRELFPHKLDSELVEKLLQQVYEEISEEELVERLMEKRKIARGQKLTQKERNRLLKYLQRRGHRWEVIKVVLDNWLLAAG